MKITKYSLYALAGIIIIIALMGMFKFNYLANKDGYDPDGNKIKINDTSLNIEDNRKEKGIKKLMN